MATHFEKWARLISRMSLWETVAFLRGGCGKTANLTDRQRTRAVFIEGAKDGSHVVKQRV